MRSGYAVGRKLVLATLTAILGAATSAQAETMFDWSGYFIGAEVGYGWGKGKGNYSDTVERFNETTANAPRYYYPPIGDPIAEQDPFYVSYVLQVYAGLSGDDVLSFEPSGTFEGFSAGGRTGHNWQNGQIVYGWDASLSYFAGSGQLYFDNFYPGSPDVYVDGNFQADLRWIGAVRARAGYAFGRLLPYVAVGVAFANARLRGDLTVSTDDTSKTIYGDQSSTRLGLVGAFGVEVAASERISLFAEVNCFNLQPFNVGLGDGANFDFNLNPKLLKAGLNLRFQ